MDLEPTKPSGGKLVPVVGSVVGVVLALFVAKWIVGFVWGTIRFGLTLAIIAAVAYVAFRAYRGVRSI